MHVARVDLLNMASIDVPHIISPPVGKFDTLPIINVLPVHITLKPGETPLPVIWPERDVTMMIAGSQLALLL
jgi:hypothetical protein